MGPNISTRVATMAHRSARNPTHSSPIRGRLEASISQLTDGGERLMSHPLFYRGRHLVDPAIIFLHIYSLRGSYSLNALLLLTAQSGKLPQSTYDWVQFRQRLFLHTLKCSDFHFRNPKIALNRPKTKKSCDIGGSKKNFAWVCGCLFAKKFARFLSGEARK